jgi:hypothetical protein
MTAIHLTDAQRDTFAACGLIVIDGQKCAFHAERPWHPLDAACVCGQFAPEGWRILTEPCAACDGRGYQFNMFAADSDGSGYTEHSCLKCVGGRRVVTLTATCPECTGTGTLDLEADDYLAAGIDWKDGADDRPGLEDCFDCKGEGVVTLGRFTIPALLPVVDEYDPMVDMPVVVITRQGRAREHVPTLIDVAASPEAVELFQLMDAPGPGPRPGQFIARPERVE